MTLTLVSLFDGIGGFPLAFERAGATTVATVEIDKAAAAVSARHFPHAHQFDDVTKVTGDDLRAVGFIPERGIITAGWPCQDLSVAGRRAGLGGARSGLWWEVVRLLDECHPKWFVGENVPGLLSSNDGRDMGAVVGALGELGYGFAYRVLDAQFYGVPQRRRRIFFVGHFGEPWSASAEILFELESSGGDSASGSETGAGVAGAVAAGAGVVSRSGGGVVPTVSSKWHKGTGGPSGDECQNLVLDTHTHTRFRRCRAAGNVATGSTPNRQPGDTSSWAVAALTANGVGTCGADDNQAQAGHLIATTILGGVTHTLTNEGHDASEDGTGRGTPIVVQPLALRGRDGGAELEAGEPGAPYNALRAGDGDGGASRNSLISVKQHAETIVRRLTEMECERLQGFADGWTEGQSAAARYRQLGNSVAVPCVEWIARRLIAADEVSR